MKSTVLCFIMTVLLMGLVNRASGQNGGYGQQKTTTYQEKTYSGPYGKQTTTSQQTIQQGPSGYGGQQTTTVTKTGTNSQSMNYGYGRKKRSSES